MPQIIEVPGLGIVEFPDDMPRDQIKAAVQRALARRASSPQPAGYADGVSPRPPAERVPLRNDLPQFGDEAVATTASAARRFGGGLVEQSELAQAITHPATALSGLVQAMRASGGDPIRMMAQGVAGQVQAGAERGRAAFDRMDLNTDDVSSQRGQAAQTLLAPLPVVGPMVAPAAEAIPADPAVPVDAARVTGGVAGAGLDALAARILPEAALRVGGRAARYGIESAAAKDLGRMNAKIGARATHYAGGRNPVAGARGEGITPRTPVVEADATLRKSLDRETGLKAQLIKDADAHGVIAGTGTDVAKALDNAFTERMNTAGRAFGADSPELAKYQKAYDNFMDRARSSTSFSASEMQALVDDITRWSAEHGNRSPVGLALKQFRSEVNAQLRKSVSGLEEVNTRIRDRASARKASEAQVRKEQAVHVRPGLDGAELLRILADYGVKGLATGAGLGLGGKIAYDLYNRQ